MSNTDRVEKKVILKAPRARVWRAVSDAKEFGEWFRVELESRFVEGETTRGRITYPGYEHLELEMLVEKLEPERYFSYRWRPNAVDPNADYSSEPTTLVEFELAEVAGGTLLTIRESGFDALPAERRLKAFTANDRGWAEQTKNIEQHVAKS
jgi:uncharacterized protein YndB with AHSA1/START domain